MSFHDKVMHPESYRKPFSYFETVKKLWTKNQLVFKRKRCLDNKKPHEVTETIFTTLIFIVTYKQAQ
jgi:hypothetical protein